jgi:hypothetical protein
MSLVLDGTNGLSEVDGSAATPAIRGTDTNTGIFFPAADTIAFSEGGVEAMRLDSSRNLGVGTTSPANRLSIGVGSFASATSQTTGMYTNGTSGLVMLSDAYSFNSRTGSGFMNIDSSGNLLVGRTSAVGRFDVETNKTVGMYMNGLTGLSTLILFDFNGTSRGSITTNGVTVAYNTSSDYRLKNTIAPMTGALAKVALLKPCTYKWNVDGSEGQGFIAHELQEVVPQCVTGEKDAVDAEGKPVYQGIDTSFLVATLTAAIQEQQAIITALTAQVAALDARLISLEGTQP